MTGGKHLKSKDVFIAESPIDLLVLYRNSEKNIEHNFSEAAVQESNWVFEKELWWRENRMADYDQMNAYYIKQLSESLKDAGIRIVDLS